MIPWQSLLVRQTYRFSLLIYFLQSFVAAFWISILACSSGTRWTLCSSKVSLRCVEKFLLFKNLQALFLPCVFASNFIILLTLICCNGYIRPIFLTFSSEILPTTWRYWPREDQRNPLKSCRIFLGENHQSKPLLMPEPNAVCDSQKQLCNFHPPLSLHRKTNFTRYSAIMVTGRADQHFLYVIPTPEIFLLNSWFQILHFLICQWQLLAMTSSKLGCLLALQFWCIT